MSTLNHFSRIWTSRRSPLKPPRQFLAMSTGSFHSYSMRSGELYAYAVAGIPASFTSTLSRSGGFDGVVTGNAGGWRPRPWPGSSYHLLIQGPPWLDSFYALACGSTNFSTKACSVGIQELWTFMREFTRRSSWHWNSSGDMLFIGFS